MKKLKLISLCSLIIVLLSACSNFNNITQIPLATEYTNDYDDNYIDETFGENHTNNTTNNTNNDPDWDDRVNIYGDIFTDVSVIIKPYTEMNDNIPYFTESEINIAVNNDFENYAKLDSLGRCGVAYANLCMETMPTEERGNIGNVKPTGWNQEKYPGIVNSNPAYLYNRCHLIGFQLAGENANKQNLITGTRYFNLNMLPFENEVADYIESTNNHVLYRVTPVYYKENLVANGVIIEALSIEDNGEGICFNVFVFNVQPGIYIDYVTGENKKYDNYQEILDIAREAGYLE